VDDAMRDGGDVRRNGIERLDRTRCVVCVDRRELQARRAGIDY
jgi:hypothetical protein